jgi:hypothetical protein
MIYFDGVHLLADSLDELHAAAKSVGLKPSWFQRDASHPHYDCFGSIAAKAGRKFGVTSSTAMMRRYLAAKGTLCPKKPS